MNPVPISAPRRATAVWFQDLARWDIKTARAAAFRAWHPDFVPFGTFIEECVDTVRPVDTPGKEWPVYGVDNKRGVFFSHRQLGSEFRTAYKVIRQDWFFHNPTRANVGSLGRVPNVESDAITSPEYQVWRVKDPEWLPEYVEILIEMPFFVALIEVHRVGAVKERLYAQNLLEIPVPPRARTFQHAIVEKWRAANAKFAAETAAADRLEHGAARDFLHALGFRAPEEVRPRKTFAVMWSELGRWGVDWNRQRSGGMDLESGRYPTVPLDSILDLVQYGTSEKANTERRGMPVVRMNNIVDGSLNLADLKHVVLPKRDVERLQLADGDLLFNRTNSKELVGKCAVFHETLSCVFASYLIRVRVVRDRADPDFVAHIINGPVGRQQIDAMSRQIIGQANVNSRELRSLRVPLPPVEVQKLLISAVAEARRKAAECRREASEHRQRIGTEMEAAILDSLTGEMAKSAAVR